MSTITLVAINLFGLAFGSPISFYNNWNSGSEHSASLGSFGGGEVLGHGGGGGGGGVELGGHEALNLATLEGSESGYGGGSGNQGGYYGGIAVGHGGSSGDSGASASHGGGGDYPHGVSIVGGGGGAGKGAQTSFDLTHHGGDGHTGIYGGSFVVSGKHEGGDSAAHASFHGGSEDSGSSHLSHPGLGAFGGGWGGGHSAEISEHY